MSQKIRIYNPITDKETKIDPHGRTAKKIYKFYIDSGTPLDILPDDLTYNNGRFIKVKPIEDISNVRRITYAMVNKADNQLSFLYNVFKQYAGQKIQIAVKYVKDEINIQKEEIINIPKIKGGFSKWWKSLMRPGGSIMVIGSDEWIFSEDYNKYDDPKLQAQLLIFTMDKVGKSNYQQYFLDGTSHCVFQPIKQWAESKHAEAQSKTTEKRYRYIVNKCDKYMIEYKDGVPESAIPAIANELQITIEIDLPSTMMEKKTKYIYHRSQKKPLTTFKFVNTRLNHIEVNAVRSLNNWDQVSQEELENIYWDEKKKNNFILYKQGYYGLTQVNTLSTIYKLNRDEDPYIIAAREFQEKNNLQDYKIEYNKNKKLSDFLYNNRGFNLSSWVRDHSGYVDDMDRYTELMGLESDKYDIQLQKNKDLLSAAQSKSNQAWIDKFSKRMKTFDYIESFKELNHIDMKSSYASGHNCDYYGGYLGNITDFRKTDKIEGIGIYKIYDIEYTNPILKKLNVLHEGNAYPSPELQFYQDIGVNFKISMGCWGTRFDIEWTPDMMKEVKGTKNYCKWYGCLAKLNQFDSYRFDCNDVEFAKLQNQSDDCDVCYSEDLKVGLLDYKKRYVYHSAQIENFIHGYCRISMIQQCLKFKEVDQIVAVQLDGIYYSGDVEIQSQFRQKESKSLRWIFNHDGYIHKADDCLEDYNDLPEYRKHNQHEVHLGAGGCGKTHAQLVDKGFVNPLFIAPSWKLARNKQSEYGMDSSVFFYLLDQDPQKWLDLKKYYSVFIIDEISMLSQENKEKILKRFPEHKIIFCGDIGYQLPPIEGTEFEIGSFPVFHHTTNYRCKCKILEEKLLLLRKMISKNPKIVIDCEKIITESLKLDIIDADIINYSVEDMIITNTNFTKDIYTDRYKHLEKYRVLENTRDWSNGEIVIGPKPEKVRCELIHGFTIYSAQGETAKHKLFIDVDRMSKLKQLYTAMSRVRTIDQLVFIK